MQVKKYSLFLEGINQEKISRVKSGKTNVFLKSLRITIFFTFDFTACEIQSTPCESQGVNLAKKLRIIYQ